jgi:hypothetical protein
MTDPIHASKKLPEVSLTPEQEARAHALCDEICDYGEVRASRLIVQQIDEIERLRTALRGIQSCSACEACRGAADRALGGEP